MKVGSYKPKKPTSELGSDKRRFEVLIRESLEKTFTTGSTKSPLTCRLSGKELATSTFIQKIHNGLREMHRMPPLSLVPEAIDVLENYYWFGTSDN